MRLCAFAFALIGVAAGCSLLHHGQTPQQKFLDALNRGNSAEASQIWLTMTPDDREKFRRGEGLSPAVPPEEAMKMIDEQGASGDEGPLTIRPNTGASLLDLPAATNESQSGDQQPPMNTDAH